MVDLETVGIDIDDPVPRMCLIGLVGHAALRHTATTGAPASAKAVAIPRPGPRLGYRALDELFQRTMEQGVRQPRS